MYRIPRLLCLLFLLGSTVALTSCDSNGAEEDGELIIEDREIGTGREAVPGKIISVHYTSTFEDGRLLDTTLERGFPLWFQLGVGQVIEGWDEGIPGMREGGRRILTIPPNLAYGSRGTSSVPGGSTLVFDVTLVEVEGELEVEDLDVGTGAEATVGDNLVVHYEGRFVDGDIFDSSYDRDQTFSFTLGVRQVISGWDEGLVGMRVGGTRQLTIPPSMANGVNGTNSIPPGATLIFEVELVDIQ